ncbi:class I SAM-dependent methyltransferase [Rhodococcus sp. D2-41]|uniref:Class I SAM-dependent methyltransferase n=1 Tax=Speluncibacter jeojiensis TaxID=2710754 RepID=A0A9X4M2Z6_9ACTN|nr:class I SAM-dependent methyltransferase [Rhodococcus sp. D2-41]MDG3012797.1 class I SAM-dependent methyltransferase [Rhodococcus sp. D2-41]MDG3017115.1 class I SAM-dependent methyltransferase [Corynebacteriales bacterium D3-21]
MGYSFGSGDVAFLRSAVGTAALAEVADLELSTRTRLADVATVRARFGERGAALIETVLLRRRAVGKLTDPGRWLLTDEALQQATPTAVACHRADRLAGRSVHDVTCSVGAELDALTATCPQVLGSDLDPVRLDMARTNVPAAAVFRADALTSTSRGTVVLADPARRSGGTRRFDPAALMPPLPDLLAVHRGRDLAVKCAPGLDFDRLDWAGEVELVSLDGRVREACLWSEGLAGTGVRRRATVLRTDGRLEAVTDALPDDLPEREPGQWLIDPDGAIVRAGLVRHYGAAHGLWQLDPRIAYLTGDEVPEGVRGFRILERLKYSEKALRQELVRHDCGILEILVRGLDVDPDALRRRMKLRGSSALSVVLTRIGRTPTAFICRV